MKMTFKTSVLILELGPLTAYITMEVKTNHAHITTQRILKNSLKSIFQWDVWFAGLAAMLSISRLTTSKNIDEITL